MKLAPDKHHRRSTRLKGYDYSQAGAYFVTVCTQSRQCLFGDVADGEMRMNDAGRMVERWWFELAQKFPSVKTDAHVVMPNHFHGIIMMVAPNQPAHVGADLCVCPQGAHTGAPLPQIIQWFKTMTTNEYIRGVRDLGWVPFLGKLWQRNYYEHIIRDEDELGRIRQYILDNPAKWPEDTEHPQHLARARARIRLEGSDRPR